MRPGRDVDHPPPSIAEVMKEWSYTSTPPLGPCGLLQGETLPYLMYGFGTVRKKRIQDEYIALTVKLRGVMLAGVA